MKKVIFAALLAFGIGSAAQAQSVAINTDGTAANASAILDVQSTTQGVLVPRMTLLQRNAITGVAGLLIYQTDNTPGFYFYNGSAWTSLNGTNGTNGTNGAIGPMGPQGLQGMPGTNGTNGTQGIQGVPGTNGTNGTNGAQGLQGLQGIQGIPGTNGTNGTNGQGVPTGGGTGQVLSKIDATDYNTQWTTPSGGGSLPTQTGNEGKYLKTNGSVASWEVPVNLELLVTKTATVTTSIGSSLNAPDIVTFDAISPNSTLTGGNTWTSNNRFTANTAGLYLVTVHLISNTTGTCAAPQIEMNGTGNNSTSYYGFGSILGNVYQNGQRGRGAFTAIIYMAAGEFFQIRATSNSTVQGAELLAGYSKLTIVKLQ